MKCVWPKFKTSVPLTPQLIKWFKPSCVPLIILSANPLFPPLYDNIYGEAHHFVLSTEKHLLFWVTIHTCMHTPPLTYMHSSNQEEFRIMVSFVFVMCLRLKYMILHSVDTIRKETVSVHVKVKTYMLFSKAIFLSSSVSIVADHWLSESSVMVLRSSSGRMLELDLCLWNRRGGGVHLSKAVWKWSLTCNEDTDSTGLLRWWTKYKIPFT